MKRATRPTRQELIREAVQARDDAIEARDWQEYALQFRLLRQLGATPEEIMAVYMVDA